MASDNKVNVVVTTTFAGLVSDIEADVAAEQANGFNLVGSVLTQYVDLEASGNVRQLAVLTYNKVGGSAAASPTSTADLENGDTYQNYTISAVASNPMSALGSNTTHALVTIEDADVRVRFDGTDPTASEGHLLQAPFAALWSKALAEAAKFIRATSTDALLKVSRLAKP